MTNIQNIDKVIAKISSENNYFNMYDYAQTMKSFEVRNGYVSLDYCNTFECKTWDSDENVCGTASCICGWANQIQIEESGKKVEHFTELTTHSTAQKWLGINASVAEDLFRASHDAQYNKSKSFRVSRPDHNMPLLRDITRTHAIAVLEHLKQTGKTDWTVEH